MMMSQRPPRPAFLIRLMSVGLLFVLGAAIAYKIKRMLQLNVFPDVDMVPDEELKALLHYNEVKEAVIWFFHLVF
jgi:hypothetical protein